MNHSLFKPIECLFKTWPTKPKNGLRTVQWFPSGSYYASWLDIPNKDGDHIRWPIHGERAGHTLLVPDALPFAFGRSRSARRISSTTRFWISNDLRLLVPNSLNTQPASSNRFALSYANSAPRHNNHHQRQSQHLRIFSNTSSSEISRKQHTALSV